MALCVFAFGVDCVVGYAVVVVVVVHCVGADVIACCVAVDTVTPGDVSGSVVAVCDCDVVTVGVVVTHAIVDCITVIAVGAVRLVPVADVVVLFLTSSMVLVIPMLLLMAVVVPLLLVVCALLMPFVVLSPILMLSELFVVVLISVVVRFLLIPTRTLVSVIILPVSLLLCRRFRCYVCIWC